MVCVGRCWSSFLLGFCWQLSASSAEGPPGAGPPAPPPPPPPPPPPAPPRHPRDARPGDGASQLPLRSGGGVLVRVGHVRRQPRHRSRPQPRRLMGLRRSVELRRRV